jgi:hypothetical protein
LRAVFLLSFGAGLAIAVYTMLHGVEKNRGAVISRPAPHLNLPALAGLMVVFGAVGYLLVRNTGLSSLVMSVIAAASGVAGWIGMTFLMAKWALRPSDNSHDEAEEVQGQLAVVVNPIGPTTEGSIRYERNGKTHEVAARNLSEGHLPRGADVVIDRFEADVAIVEDWAAVEQRL